MNFCIKHAFLLHLLAISTSECFAITANNKVQQAHKIQHYTRLEEIIVTAQKREERLQDTPIAIAVLTEKQLTRQSVNSLGDLIAGTVSSLNINPFSNASSTLSIAIRGNGTGDVAQSSRDANVAVYLDEIYLARAQGLDFELAELERIEILRGPQGTLFGRNTTAGAINIISKRPSGKFGIRQTVNTGNYNLHSSNTHIDLPEWAGLSSKIDYLYSKRDGWVNNIAANESDHNAFVKKGYRISIDFSLFDNFTADYSYNDSNVETTHLYYQFYRDFFGIFGAEGGRQNTTRLPITPLDPTKTEQQLNSLNLNWTLSDNLIFQSLSSYRELDDKTRNNFAGSLYYNGIIDAVDIEQKQSAQEFRLVGSYNRFDWVAGLYYYEEKTNETVQQFFSLDILGSINGTPLTPITPPTTFDAILTHAPVALREVKTELESTSMYGQGKWTPPILDDKLEITIGVRHTRENKSGALTIGGGNTFNIPSDNETDPSITLNYNFHDDLSLYTKWSTAHRSGGVNSRSNDLTPFEKENADTLELGLKMQGWSNRLRLNATLFQTNYDGMFIDVFDPSNLVISNTINAANTVEVDGAEIDLTLAPFLGLTLGLSYTYLDGDMPNQPTPFNNGDLEPFLMTQTPEHAGSLTLDYEFPRFSVGSLVAHLDIVSSSAYNHWPSGGRAHPDGYILFNARIDLTNISLGDNYGNLSISAWGKNLADEQYIVSSFHFEGAATIHAFGDPRTMGINVKYEY